MAVVKELFTSRMQSRTDNISERSRIVMDFVAIDFASEEAALDAVEALAPDTYNDARFHSSEIVDRINNAPNIWRARVNYIGRPASIFQYSSTGGTQHITQSIATVAKYGPKASDLQGAIGFDGENVAGVDKIVPVFNWTETHFLTDDQLNIAAYYALTGHVNSDTFEGYDPGEVLFYGADAQEREDGLWQVDFKFGYQPNSVGIQIKNIPESIEKKGWEYLWVYYEKSADTNVGVKISLPAAVYIEQIYDYGPFSLLGIPDAA